MSPRRRVSSECGHLFQGATVYSWHNSSMTRMHQSVHLFRYMHISDVLRTKAANAGETYTFGHLWSTQPPVCSSLSVAHLDHDSTRASSRCPFSSRLAVPGWHRLPAPLCSHLKRAAIPIVRLHFQACTWRQPIASRTRSDGPAAVLRTKTRWRTCPFYAS